MEYKTISLNNTGNICVLKLNRPEKLNILSQIFFEEFESAIDFVFNDKGIKVLIITGTDKVFSAGGDLKEMESADRVRAKVMCIRVQKAFASLMALEIPVIAVLSGIVYGGGLELALHCDIRFCSEKTDFKLPESDLGLIPGAGGISLFSKIFSNADVAYYLMSGEQIPVSIAFNKGLVQKVFRKETYFEDSMQFAEKLAQKNRNSLAAIKRILVSSYFESTSECLNSEVEEFSSVLDIDGKNKIKSFFETKKIKNKLG